MVNPILLIATVTTTLFLWSCADSPTEPTGGQLSMTSFYTVTAPPAATSRLAASSVSGLAVDSISISRARFVLRDIEVKSTTDSVKLRTQPLVLELNLGSTLQDVGVTNVPFGTYQRVEFDVHRVDSSDLNGMSTSETAPFADFLGGERYSIIIDGTVYSNGDTGRVFQFQSKVDAKQKYDLTTPIVISGTSTSANVTLVINSAGWFKNSSGVVLDPSDVNNESMIGENLKASIRVFKDDNKDGIED